LNAYRIPVHSHELGVGDVREPAALAGTILLFVFADPGNIVTHFLRASRWYSETRSDWAEILGSATALLENPKTASDNLPGTSTNGARRVTPIHMVSSCASFSDTYVISIQP
jgi:hypothetical protein